MRGETKGKGRVRVVITILATLSLLGILAAPSGASYIRPGVIERITRTPNGEESRGDSSPAQATNPSGVVTRSGRFVAFSSDDPFLTEINDPVFRDVFVFDRKTETTRLVSISSQGVPALGGHSSDPSISDNGRYIAFQSSAPNLVVGDTNLKRDAFVHDRVTGATKRVSVKSNGDEAGTLDVLLGDSLMQPSISGAGRYVAFSSSFTDLVNDDTNNSTDVFVHDRRTGVAERISVAKDGSEADESSSCPSITPDGRYVAFTSFAHNLVPGDHVESDGTQHLFAFIKDRRTGAVELVSAASDGSAAAGGVLATSVTCSVGGRAISADGRYVVFQSTTKNLVPNDSRPTDGNVFIRDRISRRTQRLSVSSHGEEADGVSWGGELSISADGRTVAFMSSANNLVEGDTGLCLESADPLCAVLLPFGATGDGDVFVHDVRTGATEMVSVNNADDEAEPCPAGGALYSTKPSVNVTGRYVAFASCSNNLEPGDANDAMDVFVRDRGLSLGIGGFGGSPPPKQPPDDRICITPDVCIPPGAAVSSADATDDLDEALTDQGANLYGASLANRPQYSDLFAVIELQHMPPVLPGISPIFYGLRFEAAGKSYEVRATSLLGGTFGLFDCTDGSRSICTKIADLRGGYGTTGMRVVFSLPLDNIGLENGRELKDVEAFSALGGYATGATKVLDRVLIK